MGLLSLSAVVLAVSPPSLGKAGSRQTLRYGVASPRAPVASEKRAASAAPLAAAADPERAVFRAPEDGVAKPPTPGHRIPGILLIKNIGALYAPERVHARHVLVVGDRIAALFAGDEDAWAWEQTAASVIDADNAAVAPGIVDVHVHITGGGGEAGPASRTPQAELSRLIRSGHTTLVGITGTDDVSRSLENLHAKCRELNELGLTCRMWTGSYAVPVQERFTMTGSVRRDVALIDEVIGVGEIALSDHRGTQPSTREIAAVAADSRIGGLLSGKGGIVHVHMGPGDEGLDPLFKVLETTDLPISQFLPTHMSRTSVLLEHGQKWIKMGGCIDMTAGNATVKALQAYASAGVDLSRVSISTDAYGSLPRFDPSGKLIGYAAARPETMLETMARLVEAGWDVEDALALGTSRPAAFVGLKGKGRVAVGYDADLMVFDADTWRVRAVVARGEQVAGEDWVRGGMFETGDGVRPYVPGGPAR
ncbi:unnamed protein product [Pedinophyceae sp. YPF-701]|nr:unnamed protein product [Pedinophyceae sp. YPF-701]